MNLIDMRRRRFPDYMIDPYLNIEILDDYYNLSNEFDLFLMIIEKIDFKNKLMNHFVVGLEGELFNLKSRNKNHLYKPEEIFPKKLDDNIYFDLMGYHGFVFLSGEYLMKNQDKISRIINYNHQK